MKAIDIIYKICLALLIGTGLQFFMYGMFTFKTIDFSSYSVFNWILQTVYFAYCVTLSLKFK
jgi:hypothetical protein